MLMKKLLTHTHENEHTYTRVSNERQCAMARDPYLLVTQIQHLTSLYWYTLMQLVFSSSSFRSVASLHNFCSSMFVLLPRYKRPSHDFYTTVYRIMLGPRPSNFPSIPLFFFYSLHSGLTQQLLFICVSCYFEGSCFIEFTFITVQFCVNLHSTIQYLLKTTIGQRS